MPYCMCLTLCTFMGFAWFLFDEFYQHFLLIFWKPNNSTAVPPPLSYLLLTLRPPPLISLQYILNYIDEGCYYAWGGCLRISFSFTTFGWVFEISMFLTWMGLTNEMLCMFLREWNRPIRCCESSRHVRYWCSFRASKGAKTSASLSISTHPFRPGPSTETRTKQRGEEARSSNRMGVFLFFSYLLFPKELVARPEYVVYTTLVSSLYFLIMIRVHVSQIAIDGFSIVS